MAPRAKFKTKQLVARAHHASGHTKLGLGRLQKGHWMRKDAAANIRKQRSGNFPGGFGRKDKGIPPRPYN